MRRIEPYLLVESLEPYSSGGNSIPPLKSIGDPPKRSEKLRRRMNSIFCFHHSNKIIVFVSKFARKVQADGRNLKTFGRNGAANMR